MTNTDIYEDIDEMPPEPRMTEEAAIIAQSKDPVDYTELDWEVVNPSSATGKDFDECELHSCKKEISHYVEFLSGRMFFGCEQHVDELVKMQVARKKQKFE